MLKCHVYGHYGKMDRTKTNTQNNKKHIEHQEATDIGKVIYFVTDYILINIYLLYTFYEQFQTKDTLT